MVRRPWSGTHAWGHGLDPRPSFCLDLADRWRLQELPCVTVGHSFPRTGSSLSPQAPPPCLLSTWCTYASTRVPAPRALSPVSPERAKFPSKSSGPPT